MIPQERGLEGINIYFLFYLPFLFKEGDQLCELLGEVQEVLDSPQEIIKPITGLIVGLVVGCGSLVDGHWLVCSFPSAFCTILSLMPFHALTYPSIDPSSPASWLGKGKGTTKN
jgi:hypothetical protein